MTTQEAEPVERSCGCDEDYHYADCPIRKHDLEAQEPDDDFRDFDERRDRWAG